MIKLSNKFNEKQSVVYVSVAYILALKVKKQYECQQYIYILGIHLETVLETVLALRPLIFNLK